MIKIMHGFYYEGTVKGLAKRHAEKVTIYEMKAIFKDIQSINTQKKKELPWCRLRGITLKGCHSIIQRYSRSSIKREHLNNENYSISV